MNRLPTILLAFCHKDSSRFRGPLLVTILDSLSNLSYTWCYSIFKVLTGLISPSYFRVINPWWRIQGSNLRPPACKAGALPAELIPHKQCIVQEIVFLRKEVIQPQVLLRLPCYDFTPVIGFALGNLLLDQLRAPPTSMV